jgi:hypothetical protein
MQRANRAAVAQRLLRPREVQKSTGFVETAIFSLLGLAMTILLIAHNWFPALPEILQ